MFLGHHADLIYVGVAAVCVIDDVIGKASESGPASWLTTVLVVFFFFSLWSQVKVHNHRLCERCVAAAPLDPQGQVNRWKRVLRLHHQAWPWLVAFAFFVPRVVLSYFFPDNPALFAADAVLITYVALLVMTSWTHRRLYPWCPYCHWDDGGDSEAVPDVPAPAVSR